VVSGWNHIGRLVQVFPNSKRTLQEEELKIVSYNVQNFIKVNLSSTRSIKDFQNTRKITDHLVSESADIYCIQEFLNDQSNHHSHIKEFAQKLECNFLYYRNYYASNTRIIDALAIFSSYPIIDKGYLDFDTKTIAVFTDLLYKSDTIRLYNVHLASIHFRKEDYQFFSEFDLENQKKEITDGTRKIYSKMKTAFIKRSKQVEILHDHINNSKHPVIICGDFNDTPTSYAYNKLGSGKKDAFVEAGKGFGATYAGDLFPAFRIDYILHDKTFQTNDLQRHKISLSDHYPLAVIISKINPD
jgi:endonuclease/exonuclease/phosphatase family metal-dependent hydrolase